MKAKLKVKSAKKELVVKLRDDEKLIYGKELSDLLYKAYLIDWEAKKAAKAFKEQITSLEAEAHKKSDALRTGEEMRDVDCRWEYDFTTNTKTLRRLDTFEEVEKKAIEEYERQMQFEVIEQVA